MFRSLILGIEDAMRMLTKYIMAMDTWNKPLTNPDEDANRVKVRIAELFQQRALSVTNVDAVREALPNTHAVTDEGRIKAA